MRSLTLVLLCHIFWPHEASGDWSGISATQSTQSRLWYFNFYYWESLKHIAILSFKKLHLKHKKTWLKPTKKKRRQLVIGVIGVVNVDFAQGKPQHYILTQFLTADPLVGRQKLYPLCHWCYKCRLLFNYSSNSTQNFSIITGSILTSSFLHNHFRNWKKTPTKLFTYSYPLHTQSHPQG